MKLYRVKDVQGQFEAFDVEASTRTEARRLYCSYYNINPLLYVDRLYIDLLASDDLTR